MSLSWRTLPNPACCSPPAWPPFPSVIDLVPVGAIVLIPKHAYMASVTLCKDLERRGIIELVRVDIEDTASVIAAMEDAASRAGVTPENVNYSSPKVLAWLESPTNPMLEVGDLPEILAAARRLGVVTAVDNTFATPILQRPLDLGADVVVHSATKFLAGHSDVLLGMTLTSNEELYKAMLHYRITNGAIPGPMEAWLGLRGLRTLALRVERAVQNAQVLAERLSEHPSSRRCATRALRATAATRLRRSRCPASARFCASRWTPTRKGPRNVVEALKVWTPATSLGGVESLVERRRRHGSEPESIPESMLRLSVGIENVDDLYNDLVEAFKAVR